MTRDQKLCPSGRALPGSVLLGVVGADGRVGYVRPELVVDQEFIDRAEAAGALEERFRFAEPCVEHHCGHWSGGCCQLVGQVERAVEPREQTRVTLATLPRCAIRSRCRWFEQRGAEACRVCPLVLRSGPLVPAARSA